MAARVDIIVLAAGASTRMRGADKLVKQIFGRALLRRVAKTCLAAKAGEVLVVLRPDDLARRDVLGGLALRMCENPQWQAGMGTSIACGVKALEPGAQGVLVVLADMPGVTVVDLDRMIGAFAEGAENDILRASDSLGRPGNPVLFGRGHFDALVRLDADHGGREILAAHPAHIRLVVLPGHNAALDLDTPEDWDSFRP